MQLMESTPVLLINLLLLDSYSTMDVTLLIYTYPCFFTFKPLDMVSVTCQLYTLASWAHLYFSVANGKNGTLEFASTHFSEYLELLKLNCFHAPLFLLELWVDPFTVLH